MPWKDCSAMSSREEFVMLCQAEDANVSLLCRRFGVSRRVGYKWIARYEAGGSEALADRPRRPHRSPARSGEELERAVAAARARHPAWGPRKLRRLLLNEGHDPAGLAAPSTIGRILLRRGLVDPQSSAKHRPFVRFEKAHPNELWQMDFKGHVPMTGGGRCHPLTVLDDHSRFSLAVRACGDEQAATVRSELAGLFERYGQPRRVLCDNGSPWGSCGGEPYTSLGVWLMLHGVGVGHGRPRHPQTQGKDERFHRTLDDEVLGRVQLRDLADAQGRFDRFREIYNGVRPHEALGMDCPVSRYRPSERSYRPDPPPPQYDEPDQVRKVDSCGRLSFRGRSFKIGKAFVGQRLGLRPGEADGLVVVRFAEHLIGMLDLRDDSAAMCRTPPPVATLPAAGCGITKETVTHVSEQVLPLTPV